MEKSDAGPRPACSQCNAVWRTRGTTNCWSPDPKAGPPRPKHCPMRRP